MTDLSPRLRDLAAEDRPRFSAGEMERRRRALAVAMAEAGADHVVFYGANRFGSVVQWLTQWPVTTEAVGVFTPGEADVMFVQHVNHAPLARLFAADAALVEWGGPSTIRRIVETLSHRGARAGRVAVIGPMPFAQHGALTEKFGSIIDLNRTYARLRAVKSDEELDWLRIGAAFSDAGMAALRDAIRPGVSERELGDAVERAYVREGGGTWIHFIGTTPMRDPQVPAPRQYPSARRVETGDIVFAEISAHFWDYSGQVLRSFAVGVEPPPLYRALHNAADAAFDAIARVLRTGTTPAQVIAAARVIEEAGYTVLDDLLHGYGGGYLPPVLGTESRPAGPVPEEPFRAGQTVVIQPNVVTLDGKAGVQTGHLVVIRDDGIESLHAFPRGFAQL